MIYRIGEITKVHVICAACNPDYISGREPNNETIPIYYSGKEAADKGWRKTSDIIFCPPDKKYVWVCPKCWAGDES